jgi:hypothetical protein
MILKRPQGKGLWAGGLLIDTLLLKVAIPVFSGEVSGRKSTR